MIPSQSSLKRFPREFSELLAPRGLQILNGAVPEKSNQFQKKNSYFINLPNLIRPQVAVGCIRLLDKHLHHHLKGLERTIPPESITGMRENYSETLSKVMRLKTACLRTKSARIYQAADGIGLIEMMRSESFARFAEAVTGLALNRDLNMQVSCYGQGDYAGPHNDHHPEHPEIRDGYLDFHVMFANDAVAHHYLVYAERGHFSKIVDINVNGAISIYKLPFWHYTTPLESKPGREREARRWLLMGSFCLADR